MRVLQIYKTYFPDTVGGVEAVIQNIYSETQKQGIQQSLLTLSQNPREDQIEGLQVKRLKTNFEIASCPFSWQFFKDFKRIAASYDILHFHYPWPFADFTDLLQRVDRPSLVTFHADALKHPLLKKLYRPFQKRFLAKVDRIVPTSLPLMRTSPDLQAFSDKCTVIPIGIDPKSYCQPNQSKLADWQQKFGSSFALFVGVLRHYKGLHTLIEAAKMLKTPIVIAGAGPLFETLKSQILEAGLKHVHLLGRVSEEDKMALYQLCQMVILPSCSRSEAFGVSLLEGLMSKKPLISTELGTGTSYVNQDQRTGFVIPPEDPEALKEAILKLSDRRLASQMGEAAYEWFLQEFQSAIMGQRYIELYQDLLK